MRPSALHPASAAGRRPDADDRVRSGGGGLRRRVAISAVLLAALAGAAPARQTAGEMVDPRDQQRYGTVEVAGLRWATENLRYAAPGSRCYQDLEEHCAKHGRLYSWETALNACPPGWHLATDYEWQQLELELGVPFAELAGRAERGEPTGNRLKPGGDHPLSFPLAGYSDPHGDFRRLGHTAAIWTATEADLEHAWHRDLTVERTGIWRSRVYKPWLLSVRCVENRGAPPPADEPAG